MKFKSSESEIKNAIDILDSLINAKPTTALETIRNYKASKNIDMFTIFRLNKELDRLNNLGNGR